LGARLELLCDRLQDERSGKVLVLSHCLLNQNVRYLGGAVHPGMVDEVVAEARRHGWGLYQLPCPEQRAWGGLLKPSIAPAFGSKGPLRYRSRRPLLWLFTRYTSLRYRGLARRMAGDIADYPRSGFAVAGIVGVAGSPSCGVHRTLELSGAVEAMAACPLATLDREAFNQQVIAANVVAGEGLFHRPASAGPAPPGPPGALPGTPAALDRATRPPSHAICVGRHLTVQSAYEDRATWPGSGQ
jgi:predicted secreted protein